MSLDGTGSLDVTNALSAASMDVAGNFSATNATLDFVDVMSNLRVKPFAGGSVKVGGPGHVEGEARYYLYNGGRNTEWLFGQKSSSDHAWRLSSKNGATESDYFNVLNNGNVGIGTNSPSSRLEVIGSTKLDTLEVTGSTLTNTITTTTGGAGGGAVYFGNANHGVGRGDSADISSETSGNDVVLYTAGGGGVIFAPGKNEQMRVQENGNVGVGINDPTAKLHVAGGRLQVNPQSQGAIRVLGPGDCRYLCYNDGGVAEWAWGQKSQNDSHWKLSMLNNGNEVDMISANPMNGNVGIGISDPQFKLHVDGSLKCPNVLTTGVRNTDGELYLGADQTAASSLNYNTPHNTSIFYGTTPTAVFGNGRIGFGGVTAPDRELHARGTLRLDRQAATSIIMTTWEDGDFSSGVPVKSFNIGTDATGFKISDIGSNVGGGGADRLFITSSGNLGVNTSAPTESLQVNGSIVFNGALISESDERLKDNIETIDGALDKVTAMRGVSFSWKSGNPSKTKVIPDKYLGFIAQEVREVVPELVHENNDGFMSVEYNNTVALLVEAVKELNAKVDALTAA